MNDLWLEFKRITKLDSVVARMRELEVAQDTSMLEVLDYLRGEEFRRIAQHLWESQDYTAVSCWTLVH